MINISAKICVSVIIPFYNAQDTLNRCLDGLAMKPTDNTEIILVDNNSTDRSFELCKNFQQSHPDLRVELIKEHTQGPSAARNAGAKIAKGDWLIFTDADCVPSPNWISDYSAHFRDDNIGAVAGAIWPSVSSDSNAVQKSVSLFTLPPITEEKVHNDYNINEGLYPTANIAVRKKIFELIGGFNGNLSYGEDHELCYKIYKAGFKIKAVTNAIVRHIHRSTMKGLLKQAFGFGSAHPFELRRFTPGRTILTFPFYKINMKTPGRWVWIDFNQADKKLLISFIPGLLWPPLFLIPLIFFIYLCFFIKRIGDQRKVEINLQEIPFLSILLFLKSIALTAGRIRYSFKHKVVCI